MRPLALAVLFTLAWQPVSAGRLRADPMPLFATPPGMLCRQAIATAARAHDVPASLMAAVGQVESGRRDPVSGALHPWPWTVDAAGQGAFYDTQSQAIAAVRALQARGVRSIDVGCMQVNLQQHPNAFASLEQAFDPQANADYAARFLSELYRQTGAWPQAAALYHSATPSLGATYRQKVMQAWPAEARMAAAGSYGAAWAPGAGAVLDSHGFAPPPRRPAMGHIIPRAVSGGAAASPGRGLNAYRSAPVMLGWRRARG